MKKPIQLLLALLCIALLFLSPSFRVSADESPRAALECFGSSAPVPAAEALAERVLLAARS